MPALELAPSIFSKSREPLCNTQAGVSGPIFLNLNSGRLHNDLLKVAELVPGRDGICLWFPWFLEGGALHLLPVVPRGGSTPPAVYPEVCQSLENLSLEVAGELQEEAGECILLLELTLWFNKQFKGKRNSFLLAVENLTQRC